MLTLVDVLNWGYRDIEELEKYIKVIQKLGLDIDNIKEYIESYGGDMTNINDWFYSTINIIFETVMNMIDDPELKESIDEEFDNFCPYINYMDSWFDNFFDDIDLTQDMDKIIEDVKAYLRGEE